LQRIVKTRYAGVLRLEQPYGCRRKPLRCRGEFANATRGVKVAFGLLYPTVGSPRYILLYV
jgi:hypothetical protein